MVATIDLNSDLGESFGMWKMGDDAALLKVVSSANIACGFHAGDPSVLLATCREAVARGVQIGAHVAYRDLAGFGRSFIDLPADQLHADVLYQLAAIEGVARTVGGTVGYVKPHGALYNTIVHHEQQAEAVVSALVEFSARRSEPLALLGLPGSVVLAKAEQAGVRPVREAFCDRAYNPDGTLVSRRTQGAVLHDPKTVAERMVHLVITGELTAIDGSTVAIEADSLCVHGDSPGAVAMAEQVRAALGEAGIGIRAFGP